MDNTSVWLSTSAPAVSQPLDGDRYADIVVVGAGITGLTAALLLAQAGREVVVCEGRTIGAGATGNTTAKVTALQGTKYTQLATKVGTDGARAYAAANVAGIALVRQLASELAPDCNAVDAPTYTFAWPDDGRDDIDAEIECAKSAGLDVDFVEDTELPFPVAGAARWEGGLHFHPQRYLLGLAREIERLGGLVYQNTPVTSIDENDGAATVTTKSGSVRCAHVVVATLLPIVDRGGFFAKAEASRSYALAATLQGPPPDGMYLSAGSPTRSVRPMVLDGKPAIVASGPSHKPGTESDTERFYSELEFWVRDTFDVSDVAYRWSAQDYSTADGVPYVGRCPRTENIYVATGFDKWGLANGSAAGVMLRDLLTGEDNPWFETFDATRLPSPRSAPQLLRQNLDVAHHAIVDRLERVSLPDVQVLEPGEGGLVKIDGETVGAYRDEDGQVIAVSPSCTHLGCTVQWNSAERSWDCPCHGSRFDRFGDVLEGPAVEPLTVRLRSNPSAG